MILRCEGLTKSFDGTRALAGVSVEFPASCVIAIIGPNGAGKTTLLNVLTGSWSRIGRYPSRCWLWRRHSWLLNLRLPFWEKVSAENRRGQ